MEVANGAIVFLLPDVGTSVIGCTFGCRLIGHRTGGITAMGIVMVLKYMYRLVNQWIQKQSSQQQRKNRFNFLQHCCKDTDLIGHLKNKVKVFLRK